MNVRHYYYYSLVLLLLPAILCPAAGVKAQYIKKERLPDKDGLMHDFAVFYADGMPETAQWPLGTVIVDEYGRTTRHQVNKGNGRNRNINSKVSARFIISPFDVPMNGREMWGPGAVYGQWNYAVSEETEKSKALNEQFYDTSTGTGCYWFGGHSANKDGKYNNRKWRMPTQRELMIMMVLQDGINAIYGEDQDPGYIPQDNSYPGEPTKFVGMNDKIYWSSTEEANPGSTTRGDRAWVVDFSKTNPKAYPTNKTNTIGAAKKYKLRCVSDY